MGQFLAGLALVDYLFMTLLAFSSIENHGLARLFNPIQTYHPFYSEVFTGEMLLILMSIAGTVLLLRSEKESEPGGIWKLPGRVALLLTVLAAPARLMTAGLIAPDTAFFALTMFFSLFISLLLARFLLSGSRATGREIAGMLAAIAVLFLLAEPWNSPSLKLRNAVEGGNASALTKLAGQYPLHMAMNSSLLNFALKKSDPEIIKIIIEKGNKSFDPSYMDGEIFASENFETLKFMHAAGVNLARQEVLKAAVEFYARRANTDTRQSSTSPVDKNYPVLKWLVDLYKQAPEEERKPRPVSFSGYVNLLCIPAVNGDADLMAFLLEQGFAFDEEVLQALTKSKNFEKPEFQPILAKASAMVSAQRAETAPVFEAATVTIEAEAQTTVLLNHTAASPTQTVLPISQTASQTTASTPVTSAIASNAVSFPAVVENTSVGNSPAMAAVPASATAASIIWLQPASDALDLVITKGADVKQMRADRENIFHFIARYWRAPKSPNTYYQLDYPELFKTALERQVDINRPNVHGQTPLWVALYENNFRAFRKLLAAGANPEIKDAEGRTLRDFCRENGRRIILSLLEGETK